MSMTTNILSRAGAIVAVAACVGGVSLTSNARADGGVKIKHSFAHVAVHNRPVMPQGRPAPSPGGFKAASKLPSLVDRVQPRIHAKIDCLPNGCKSGPPDLYKHKKLPCKIFGCKPGEHHHGHHHGHHWHGSWAWGGITIVASDHDGCGYEYWKWKTTGWRSWKQAYRICRGWE